MKIALLGKGRTGSKILELHHSEVTVFDSTHLPTVDKLKEHEVVISFLPGDAFLQLIPMLVDARIPVVTGSTGFTWPLDLDKTLREKGLVWIYATNFSLGIVVLKQLIEKLHQMGGLFEEKKFFIHEVHHTKKLDSPSGTALSMKEWLKNPCDITAERTGDVVGHHTLTLETKGEILRLEHEAKDRKLFAEGALWAAKYILENSLTPGRHAFQTVVENYLLK